MGELEWLECVRVSPSILRAPDVLGRLDAYSEQISAQLKMLNGEQSEKKEYNVWYDKIDGVYFSGCQFNELRMFGKDQHFYTTKKRFIQHSKDQYLKNFSNIESPFLNTRFLVDKNLDFLYSNPELFDQYSGSTIMIVGGGPSTQDVAWENIRADYIWTCNEFYKNKKFNNKKVDLVSLAPLVDEHLMDSPLESCFESNEDLIAAFPIDRIGMSTAPLQEFCKKYPNQTCLYHTRYGSVIGTMNRLICLAIFAGAKKIYFVGMDGRSKCEKNGDLMHAFDGDKPVPGWYQRYGDRFQIRQFVVFYDYLLALRNRFGYDFEIYNLGEGHRHNVSTGITEKAFPLPNSTKKEVNIHD